MPHACLKLRLEHCALERCVHIAHAPCEDGAGCWSRSRIGLMTSPIDNASSNGAMPLAERSRFPDLRTRVVDYQTPGFLSGLPARRGCDEWVSSYLPTLYAFCSRRPPAIGDGGLPSLGQASSAGRVPVLHAASDESNPIQTAFLP